MKDSFPKNSLFPPKLFLISSCSLSCSKYTARREGVHSTGHKRKNHLQLDLSARGRAPWRAPAIWEFKSWIMATCNWKRGKEKVPDLSMRTPPLACILSLTGRGEASSRAARRQVYYSRQKLVNLSLLLQDCTEKGRRRVGNGKWNENPFLNSNDR